MVLWIFSSSFFWGGINTRMQQNNGEAMGPKILTSPERGNKN